MRASVVPALAAALLAAACNPAAKEAAAPAAPPADSDEARAVLQLETRLSQKVKLEHTRNGVLNAHKLYCGEVVTADGKRQPFALANGILFLESDGGKQLMDDMQKACDRGSDPANRM